MARRTGVGVSTLRAWETRYQFPLPERSASGHRVYSESDVERIAAVVRLVADGLTLPSAVGRVSASGSGARPEGEGQSLLLGQILDAVDEGVWVARHGLTRYANRSMAALLRTTVDGMITKPLNAFVEEEALAATRQMFRSARQGDTHHFQQKMFRSDGSTFLADIRTSPLFDHTGRYEGSVAVIHDATEEKEDRIRHSVQSWLLDSVSEAVAASSPDGSLLYVNAAAERVFGWRRSDVIGRDGLRLMPAPDDIKEATRIHHRLTSGKKYHGQLKLVRFDGRKFTAVLRSAPVFDEDGELLALTAVITDRSAQDRLNRSKRKLELQMEAVAVLGSKAAHAVPGTPDTAELTAEIVNSVQRLLGADQAFVLECSPDGRTRCTISPPRSTDGVFDAPWYQPMMEYMALAERAVRIDDVQNDARVDPASLPSDCVTRAAIGARVARRNGVRTVLVADSDVVARFDSNDELFLQSVANVLAGVLD